MASTVPGIRRRLGERLQDRGLLTGRQLELALLEQGRTGALLGEILLRLGLVTPSALGEALADQAGVPFVHLGDLIPDAEAVALVPEAMARRLRVLPLDRKGRDLRLAMANVFDLDALAEVEGHTLLRITVVCAAEEDLLACAARVQGSGQSLEQVLEEAIVRAEEGDAERSMTRLVDQLLAKAIRDRATDVHIQPDERTVLTRFRVDGSLVQGPSLPKALQPAVLARLKVLAEVDLSESRRPQDGRFSLPLGRRTLDVRASFLPARHGEKAVLRLLDKTNLVQGLDQLGMPGRIQERFEALLQRPHGLLLVTGPTGSGKTTTLYSALHALNSSERCLVTVEDPVEYELPLVTQVGVNPKAGITFASGLRGLLRQDPDVILVGEIRDGETASIALRAAMTGHLVLATLHAGQPVGALARLRDLGATGGDLAETLLAIHAQRLVRLLCAACGGRGCPACGATGVWGRRAIHDLLPITPAVRDLIAAGAAAPAIEAEARRQGKGSLGEHALALAAQGLISATEARRVAAEEA
ncbi:GspE/PulE family protein [Mesoterricola silvestris]|uniref:Type II secretion system protein E n=1 Tax=Mesoterricola silvestris TaxID=2927979 RepID=A0AA48K9D0_9BACT|nr:GspE/PulE family protein [Mesoterricola silvestris]BDU72202.1 type II secretion system protein E [Mesoterricola silvestris]